MTPDETWTTAIATFITTILGKIGWDKFKENRARRESSVDETIELDKPFTQGQSAAMWLAERIHKSRNELTPTFNNINLELAKLTLSVNELKIEISHAKNDIATNKAENNLAIGEIHRHLEASTNRLETGFKREIDRLYDFSQRKP